MRNENLALREEIVRSSLFEKIVGSSESLRRVLVQVSKVAPTDPTVLVLGETGTGKELIARAIHNRSKRSTRAFIRVNCAAIPPSVIASELFRIERNERQRCLIKNAGSRGLWSRAEPEKRRNHSGAITKARDDSVASSSMFDDVRDKTSAAISGIDSVTYQPKDHARQNQAHCREREIPPGRPFHLAINLLAIHRNGESESRRTFGKTSVGVHLHRPVPVGNAGLKAARFPSSAWLPGDFLSIDNQPLQASPILQLDDMSLILGLPRGFKHSEPPGVRRTVTSYQFGCGCADRAALPVALHLSQTSCRLRQRVRHGAPLGTLLRVLPGRAARSQSNSSRSGKDDRLIMRQALAATL